MLSGCNKEDVGVNEVGVSPVLNSIMPSSGPHNTQVAIKGRFFKSDE